MSLDYSTLVQAIRQLEQSLEYYHSEIAKKDPALAIQLMAAAIQAFEFTYELAVKMVQRYLNTVMTNPHPGEQWSFGDIIRFGKDYGVLKSELDIWKRYRQCRGITSHTYDKQKAAEVFQEIPSFLTEAKYLLSQLEKKIPNAR